MNSTLLGAALAVALVMPSVALAGQVNWDAEKPYDYELVDHTTKQVCTDVNATFGVPDGTIACEVDHASFEKHLAAQLKIAKYGDRDPNNPYGYCAEGAWQALWDANSAPARDYRQICTKARPEFQKLVKKVVCRYQEGQPEDKPPKLELSKDGTLVINVYHGSYVLHGDDWIVQGFRQLFPAYDACKKAHE